MAAGAKTYLVTGGCGFIGAHLVKALDAYGHRVRVLDDLSSGRAERLPEAVPLQVADVAEPKALESAFAGVDGCFHLAAVASVPRCEADWPATHRTNAGGVVSVLDRARRCREGWPVPVVFASSAAVYGERPTIPHVEHDRCRPLSGYGADKLAGELHMDVGAQRYGIPTAALRFFNVYGPDQDPHSPYSGVISVFVDRALAGAPLPLHGDGLQIRDFVYVGDVVEALMRAMARLESTRRAYGAINVCTGCPTTIRRLAKVVARVAGCDHRIERGPARGGDIRASLGSPERARRTLGWTARTALLDGLRRTLAEWPPATLARPAAVPEETSPCAGS